MRPLKLRFQAFGAYPGLHEVDFEALGRRGLFLVTGPTGTGKTTVFDAMVFALFGCLPGARSDGGEARSHYVSDDVEAFVDLEFEVDGERYRVHRTPSWKKQPKKPGGAVTTKTGTATLVRLVGGGTQPVTDQLRNVTAECERLVGLNAGQFQRVVLLPQGEFTKFLVAKEADRQDLLRRLFGGAVYEEATQTLRTQMLRLEGQVRASDTDIEHHRTNAVESLRAAAAVWDPEVDITDDVTLEQLRAAAERLVPLQRQAEAELDRQRGAATEAERQATSAEQAAARFDELQRLDGVLDSLAAQAGEIDGLRALVDASRRGSTVQTAVEKVVESAALLDDARSASDEILGRIADGFTEMGEPVPESTSTAVTVALAELAEICRKERQLVSAAATAESNAATAEGAAAKAQSSLDSANAELRAVQEELAGMAGELAALRPIADGAPALEEREKALSAMYDQRRQLVDAQAMVPGLESAEQQARSHAYQVMQAFIDTQAPRLAAELVDGMPCSVCGSTSHPQKATHTGTLLVDHEEVEAARNAANAAKTQLDTVKSRVETLIEALGSTADEPLDGVAAVVAEVQRELMSARSAADEVARLSPLHDAAVRRSEAQDLAVRAAQDLSIRAAATAETLRGEASRLADEASVIDVPRLERRERVLPRLEGVGGLLSAANDSVTAAGSVLDSHRSAAADALARSGFPTETEALAAVLEPGTEQAASDRVGAWDLGKQTAETGRDQLLKMGVPTVRPDAEALVLAAGAARGAAELLASQVNTASNEIQRATASVESAESAGRDTLSLRAEFEDACTVYETCKGSKGMKVPLERWVLSGELGRVAASANVHLARMSNGRYRLGRKGGRNALDLEVFDSNTGRARDTASLSGGEQFQASLALALGLADVISQGGTGSGKLFEALFVDEGFGSLDPKALDQAIEALLMIQQGGRMVGAITHVEAMKERLHPGIEVRPNEDGRGSTLTVNP